ncbi:uracil phosphoribosyltransferase [Shewanella sp. MF05960]|uniref:uracil phosphoribosyltransferase n=1 Tax=Shewanella sp. MF05960 TaxID=3434874 RepID=UPI003D794A0C
MLKILSENNHYLQELNTQSRSIEVRGNRLASIHQQIGQILGVEFINSLPRTTKEVTNAQGKLGTSEVTDFSGITIICLLRAGLYVSQGVRSLLGDNPHQYILSNSADDIAINAIEDQHVVIVDSVINSGKTLAKYLEKVSEAKSSMVISLVMQEGFVPQIERHYPKTQFVVSRVSQNYYVGRGTNDTGNRLFGTF